MRHLGADAWGVAADIAAGVHTLRRLECSYYYQKDHVEDLAKSALRIIDMSNDRLTKHQGKEEAAEWRAGPWYGAVRLGAPPFQRAGC